jgi:hypothetical protein
MLAASKPPNEALDEVFNEKSEFGCRGSSVFGGSCVFFSTFVFGGCACGESDCDEGGSARRFRIVTEHGFVEDGYNDGSAGDAGAKADASAFQERDGGCSRTAICWSAARGNYRAQF